jgi:hypothetical protein
MGDVCHDLPYVYWGVQQQPALALAAKFADDGDGLGEAADCFSYGWSTAPAYGISNEDAQQPSQPRTQPHPGGAAEETDSRDNRSSDATDDNLPKLLHDKGRGLPRNGWWQPYHASQV